MDIQALVAKAKHDMEARDPDNPTFIDQDVLVGEQVVTVRIWPLSGNKYRDLCALHPNRTASEFDEALGYNLTAETQSYPSVYAVDGDEVTNISDSWADMTAVLSAPDLKALEYVVWGLNEYEPTVRMAAAGKASAGSRKKKRS